MKPHVRSPLAVLSRTPTHPGRGKSADRLWTALIYDLRLESLFAAGTDGRGVQIGVLVDFEFYEDCEAAIKLVQTVAPNAYIDRCPVGRDPSSVRAAVSARRDLWLCPWGRPGDAKYAEGFAPVLDRLVAVRDLAGEEWVPARLQPRNALGYGNQLPRGPYALGDRPLKVAEGPVVAASVAVGLAALLIQRGASPIQAIRRVLDGGTADGPTLLRMS